MVWYLCCHSERVAPLGRYQLLSLHVSGVGCIELPPSSCVLVNSAVARRSNSFWSFLAVKMAEFRSAGSVFDRVSNQTWTGKSAMITRTWMPVTNNWSSLWWCTDEEAGSYPEMDGKCVDGGSMVKGMSVIDLQIDHQCVTTGIYIAAQHLSQPCDRNACFSPRWLLVRVFYTRLCSPPPSSCAALLNCFCWVCIEAERCLLLPSIHNLQ